MSNKVSQDQQNALLFGEITTILEEQRVLQTKNAMLQSRLEELLMTLELKTTMVVSTTTYQASSHGTTPQKLTALVPQLSTNLDDTEEDLAPAPIELDADATGLHTESGWERHNSHNPLDSLSLSYSYSPATNAGDNTRLSSSDGLSPAPANPSPAGDWKKADTGVPGIVISAASAVIGLFGGSPTASPSKAPSSPSRPPSSGDIEEGNKIEIAEMEAATSSSATVPSITPEERARREAAAASMTISSLAAVLNSKLASAGREKRSGLKETIEESCKLLGVPFTGVLKKDAVACYVVADSSSSPTSAPGTPTPSNPAAAYSIFSPTNPAAAKVSFLSRLQSYYSIHNPSKVDSLDEIVASFSGREDVLIFKLEKMYKAKFPPA